jgi:putative acetyltransferase
MADAARDGVSIVPYRDDFATSFAALNLEWLERFELLEDGDLPYLRDPRGAILDRGGVIFCALAEGEVVGTVAVIPQSDSVFELAKLAVAESARGRGLGRRLTQAAIDFAGAAGAEVIVLSSNHRLREAIGLYESMGFTHAARAEAGVAYATADVFMQLPLSEQSPR